MKAEPPAFPSTTAPRNICKWIDYACFSKRMDEESGFENAVKSLTVSTPASFTRLLKGSEALPYTVHWMPMASVPWVFCLDENM